MKVVQKGFTLIELMIVVAIIATLAAIAMPVYERYTIRAQVAEGLALVGPFKPAIIEYRNDNGTFPADNAEAGLGAPTDYAGRYVSYIRVDGPVVSIRYGNEAHELINGRILTVTAVANPGSISWDCTSSGAISDNYRPSACQ